VRGSVARPISEAGPFPCRPDQRAGAVSTPNAVAGAAHKADVPEPVGQQLPLPQVELRRRQAFLQTPLDRSQAALFAPPQPLGLQNPLPAIHRARHATGRHNSHAGQAGTVPYSALARVLFAEALLAPPVLQPLGEPLVRPVPLARVRR
jgi:hypothetical protein